MNWPGVSPLTCLNRRVRWLWSTKPTSSATAEIGMPEASKRLACAIRSWVKYA